MVWFQCEDCGEDLKKPKLPNHIRICSSTKFSCIDCGQTFGQESVLSHNQCMTEAEKYGPKGQGKPSNGTPAKSNSDAKKKPEVDVNVGLSSRPPWFCSLCNSSATSKQTLLLHADGKKHRAKARAFHASKEPPKEKNEAVSNGKDLAGDLRKVDSVCTKGEEPSEQDLSKLKEAENGSRSSEKKRKLVASDEGGISGKTEIGKGSSDLVDGEVIQAKRAKTLQQEDNGKKSKHSQEIKKESTNATGDTRENKHKNIKWKKLITSVLKMNPKGVMKLRKLQKLVYKSLQESGQSGDVDQVKEKLMEKINSSSKFTLDNKLVHLVVRS